MYCVSPWRNEDVIQWQEIRYPQLLTDKISYITVWALFQLLVYNFLVNLIDNPKYKPNNVIRELIVVILIVFITMIIHELVHIIAFTDKEVNKNIKIFPKLLFKFIPTINILYKGIGSRRKRQIVLLAPLVIITIIPCIFFIVFGIKNRILFNIIMLNACGCFNDIIMAFSLFKYPHNSHIYLNYWGISKNIEK